MAEPIRPGLRSRRAKSPPVDAPGEAGCAKGSGGWRWARGRLPQWVRSDIDTSDLVQDALQHTFARLPFFESKHVGALRVYLQHAVENRIRDRLRRTTRRLDLIMPDAPARAPESAAPQHQQLIDDETWRRYLGGLGRLTDRERRLIVGRPAVAPGRLVGPGDASTHGTLPRRPRLRQARHRLPRCRREHLEERHVVETEAPEPSTPLERDAAAADKPVLTPVEASAYLAERHAAINQYLARR